MEILGVRIDEVTMKTAVSRAKTFFKLDGLSMIFTPNPEIIWLAQTNEKLRNALNNADLVLPDGYGVVLASKLLKKPLTERVAGYDFLLELLKLNKKVFLLGSAEGIAEKAAKKIDNVVGFYHGYFKDDEDIINRINESGAELLVVALGAPKQELWIWKNKDKLKCKVAIGVGGALDVLAGEVKRAPKVWQNLHLEWLYRAIKQPSRLPRLMSLPKFIMKVILNKKSV